MFKDYRYIYSGAPGAGDDIKLADILLLLYKNINLRAESVWTKNINPLISRRLEEEENAMGRSDMDFEVALLFEVCRWLQDNDIPYCCSAETGSSLLLWLLGISRTNPLPAHYYCPKCKKVHFTQHVHDGFDLPLSFCPDCGEVMQGNGHDIPWQFLWKDTVSKSFSGTVFQLSLPKEAITELKNCLVGHWFVKLCGGKFTYIYDINGDICGAEIGRIVFHATDISNLADEKNGNAPLVYSLDIPMHCFSDVLYYHGLLRSFYGEYDGSDFLPPAVRYMLDNLGFSISDMPVFAEDVYSYMLSHGYNAAQCLETAAVVNKGRGILYISPEMMIAKDRWVISLINNGDIPMLAKKAEDIELLLLCRSILVSSNDLLIPKTDFVNVG